MVRTWISHPPTTLCRGRLLLSTLLLQPLPLSLLTLLLLICPVHLHLCLPTSPVVPLPWLPIPHLLLRRRLLAKALLLPHATCLVVLQLRRARQSPLRRRLPAPMLAVMAVLGHVCTT